MAKNIYRVDAKIKLDEIIENSTWKPICTIFIKKSAMKAGEYDIMQTELAKIAKFCNYAMILVVDFDNFTDYNDTYAEIREATPYYTQQFHGTTLFRIDGREKTFVTFMMEALGKIDDLHGQYVAELMKHFQKECGGNKPTEQQPQKERTQSAEQIVATTTTPKGDAPIQIPTRVHVPPPPIPDEETTPSMENKNDNIADLLKELDRI
jgi:hypothetical protein